MFVTLKWRNEKYKYHREEGPARIVKRNGKIIINEWYIDGYRHRKIYPAVENQFSDIDENDFYQDVETGIKVTNGILRWYNHGELHREGNNPALITKDNEFGTKLEYYYQGCIHRLFGPAHILYLDNETYKRYYINGKFLTENEFYKIVYLVRKFIRKIKNSIYKKYTIKLKSYFPYYHSIIKLITKV
jgi:hypothetical protein